MRFSRHNEILYDQEPIPSVLLEGDPDLFRSEPQVRTVHWSIAWSDLMMTMFVLFLVMYVFRAAKVETTIGRGEPQVAEGTALHQTEFTAGKANPRELKPVQKSLTIKADSAMDLSAVDLADDRAVRIILPGDLFFDAGLADIKPTALASLQRIAGIIRQTPYRVNVIGHTDSDPIHSRIFATNWELSAARACTVARYLIESMHIDPKRFIVTGYAENLPIDSNRTESGKSRNRRVEIVITRKMPRPTPWNAAPYRGDRQQLSATQPNDLYFPEDFR